MQDTQARSRLRPALRWLAPSAVGACVGALVGGAVEASGAGDAVSALAIVGFLAIALVPALFALALVARAVLAAWQPAALARALLEAPPAAPDEGPPSAAPPGAPRLAGWLAVVWLGTFGLGFAMYQGVWSFAQHTAFKPLTLSFLEPMLAIATVLAMLALSRPCARLFGGLAARLDARWRRTGRRTLLAPRRLLATAAISALVAGYALWRLAILPRLGPLDTSALTAPLAALAALAANHLAWRRLGRARRGAGVASALGVALALAAAGLTVAARPARTLEIWGDRPLAGLVIEAMFSLDRIRARIATDAFLPIERPGVPHRDLVLITIDTVRADRTPLLGGPAEMPALRALGDRGAVFEWAFAPSNATRRSIPSMVTGLAPTRVRGRVVGWALRVDPRHVLLAERLRAGGYDTAGFMCCNGFWGPEFHTGLERGLAHLEIDPQGTELARRAKSFLAARAARGARAPLFVWMHVLEPHNWAHAYGEPRTAEDRVRFYDRALAAADQVIADVMTAFAGRPADQQPIVIVTADHGEALGDHGQPYHSTDLYNAQIRVPWVIAGPGVAPRRIGETVSTTDLVPTVLELAGFAAPTAPLDGRSLAALALGAQPPDPEAGVAFAAMIKDRSNPGGVTAVVRGRWKLIDADGRLELYDTRRDPDERDNVIARHPELAAELRQLLAARASTEMSPLR